MLVVLSVLSAFLCMLSALKYCLLDTLMQILLYYFPNNYKYIKIFFFYFSDAPICSEKQERVYGASENETVTGRAQNVFS